MNDDVRKVFKSLSHSGEGELLRRYVHFLRDQMIADVVDGENTTLEQLEGVKQARRALNRFADHLIDRGTIENDTEDFS